MEKVIKILQESPIVYFGTVKKDGTPDVRPFNFMFEKDGRLFFCTNAKMGAYADLQHCSNVAVSVMTPQYQWIRISSSVVFTDDPDIKKAIFEANQTIRNIFSTPENPDMKSFYLTAGSATYYDYSGNPPEKFTF